MKSLLLLALLGGVAHADDYRATVALEDTNGAIHAIVTAKRSCADKAKCPAWTLDLGPAEEAKVLLLVDLVGEPAHVRDGVPSPEALPGAAKLPAAIVRTRATDAMGTHWERWAVVSLEAGRAKLIWRGEMGMANPKGGGYATPDGMELVATEAGQPLGLSFVQIPSAKNPHPIERKFVLKDGQYQRP